MFSEHHPGGAHAAYRKLMQGRTVLIIAHRLAAIRSADLILGFQHGRIVERSTFDALARGEDLSAQLVSAQSGSLRNALNEGQDQKGGRI